MSVGISVGAGILGAGALSAAGGLIGGLGSRSSSDNQSYVSLGAGTGFDSYLGGSPATAGTAGTSGYWDVNTEKYVAGNPGTPGTAAQPGAVENMYREMQGLTAAGPGASDVTAATGANRDLASMLSDYSKNGAVPTGEDVTRGNDLAKALFGYQQTSLDQNYQNQRIQAQQLAARLGRSVDDPIIQAKLATNQINQQALLDSSKGAFSANYAMNQPMQRLGFAGQRVGILNGLATQAFNNRATMLSMGNQLLNSERNWRVTTGTHYGAQQGQSGGGLGGALSGALTGLGTGLSTAAMFGAFGGNGSGAGGGTGFTAAGGGGGGYYNNGPITGTVSPITNSTINPIDLGRA